MRSAALGVRIEESNDPSELDAHMPESPITSRGVHPLHCGQRPILLLHGFLSTPGIFSSLAGRLRRWGYCAHGVDLGGVFGRYNARPIEHIARMIAEQVEELADDHGCERIDVIGHSEGGIGGRYYVQRLNGSRRVSHLVTLGTPHRGTRWAYVGYVFGQLLPSLPQMAPGSSLLRDLSDESFPIGVHLTSIYSRQDPFCPPSSCRLQTHHGAHLKNVEVARGGHLAFLFSATMSSIIRRELEAAEPERTPSTRAA